MVNFSEWLDQLLKEKGWSRSEAARRGKISASMIDKVINQTAMPGPKFCIGIARAFDIPLAEVLMRAGLMQNPYEITTTEQTISDQIINYKVTQELSKEQKDEVMHFIEFIQDRDDRRTKGNYFIEKHTRAETPPERANKEY